MDRSVFLDAIERAHRDRVGTGRRFCYVETLWTGEVYRLSVVEQEEPGHYPISEDYFAGSERDMHEMAARLNRDRLDILPRAAALIVASSMTGQQSG